MYLQDSIGGKDSKDCALVAMANINEYFNTKTDFEKLSREIYYCPYTGSCPVSLIVAIANNYKVISSGIYKRYCYDAIDRNARRRFMNHIGKPMFLQTIGHLFCSIGYKVINPDSKVIQTRNKKSFLKYIIGENYYFEYYVIGGIK